MLYNFKNLIEDYKNNSALHTLLCLSVVRVLENYAKKEQDALTLLGQIMHVEDDIRHIADWLKAAIINEEPWLNKLDDLGRPKKLMKFETIEDIVLEADKATRNGAAPIAEDGVKRIGELYRIEAELRGLHQEARLAERQERSASLVAELEAWLVHHRARVAAKSPLGEALKYIAKYWEGLQLFLTDGRIEIDNNSVERTIRPIALIRKNALFAGHEAGAENWATIALLVETCKLNAVEPQGYLTSTLTAIVNGHKQSRIDELLPWNYPAKV